MTLSAFDYSADVVLRDGSTVHLRPIRPDDDLRLLDMLHRMSEEALYYRFLSVPRIDREKAQELVRVDLERQRVLVAEYAGDIVATAGYYISTHADRAEVAFAVADAWRGRGIGTRMLECLAEIGRRSEIRTFDAYVLGENRRMIDVFLESGFAVTRQMDHGVFHVSLDLEMSPSFTERAADRSQQAAAASMRPFFEPKVIAVIGANRVRGRIGSEILHNIIASGFTGSVVPVHPDARRGRRPARRPSDIRYRRSRRSGGDRRTGGTGAGAVDDCIAKGSQGARRHQRRLRRNRRTGPGARGAAGREDQSRGHPDDRAQLHGDHQYRPVRARQRDVLAGISPVGPRRVLYAERRAWDWQSSST